MIERLRCAPAVIAGARAAGVVFAVLLAPNTGEARASHAPQAAVATLAGADSLVTQAAGPARLNAFTAWTRGARLEELVYVLRRSPDQLGDLERVALEAALQVAPADRASLRARLAARLAIVPPRDRKDGASSWAAIGLGFSIGVESARRAGQPPAQCTRYSTRADAPADVAAALDSAAAGSGVLCGGFEPASALTLAAGSRWRGLPVLVPGRADPSALRLSPRLWGIGPTGAQLGRALAGAVAPGATDRVALLVSSAADTSLARGFAAACRQRGATVVGNMTYAPGNATFASEIRALINQRATLLFWDGDPTEAAALLRQLTRERVSLRVCGGDGFDPARHHRETRVFLEGITFVSPGWTLRPDDQARLDTRVREETGGPSDEANERGYLAGRLVGAAIAAGALSPEELAVALAQPSAAGGEPGLLDARTQGAELPVYSIAAGKAARAQ